MSYQFREQAIKDSDTSIEEETQFNKEEIIKFVSLGLYAYQVLLKKDRLPET